MKKQYVKPEFFYESFELATAIANCDSGDYTVNHNSSQNCGINFDKWLPEGQFFFDSSITKCTDDTVFECYTVNENSIKDRYGAFGS